MASKFRNAFLYFIPFLCFGLGYSLSWYLLSKNEVIVPRVVGKTLREALFLLSKKELNLRVMQEQEKADLPEGVILSQSPLSQRRIRPNQTIYVVVSKKPTLLKAPDFLTQGRDSILDWTKKAGIEPKICYVPLKHSVGECFAQDPSPGQPISGQGLIVYLSEKSKARYAVPNFIGLPLSEVIESLKRYNVSYELVSGNDEKMSDQTVVVAQQPLPGSIIDFEKKLYMQLRAGHSTT